MRYDWMVAGIWVLFFLVWLVSARGTKKSAPGYGRQFLVRILIAAIAISVLRAHPVDQNSGRAFLLAHPSVRIVGVALCAIGIGCAIWARVNIGANWGMPMSVRLEPELVTSGPYAYVRHPIYSGVLLALIGSALATTLWWLAAFVVAFVYFTYAAKSEERTMSLAFPDAYPEYKRHSAMLIPFLF